MSEAEEIDALALVIKTALQEADPGAYIGQGKYDDGTTAVDGRFDLRKVAERVLHALKDSK